MSKELRKLIAEQERDRAASHRGPLRKARPDEELEDEFVEEEEVEEEVEEDEIEEDEETYDE